jgi:hypothetical protein
MFDSLPLRRTPSVASPRLFHRLPYWMLVVWLASPQPPALAQTRGAAQGHDTLLARIERSGPPERRSDEPPSQLTGGMASPPAPRSGRAARGSAGTASNGGAQAGRHRTGPTVELQIIQADGRRLVFKAIREPGTPRGVVRYRSVSGDYGAVFEQVDPLRRHSALRA